MRALIENGWMTSRPPTSTMGPNSFPDIHLQQSPKPSSYGPDWYLNKVKLKIIDVNDNVPEWNMKPYPYLAVVSPEAPAGAFVYQLQAHDGDEGKSGEVEYFLSDGRLGLRMSAKR
ncbi:neural-cadherin-like isoform X2 [Lates japonicus]|uniref:Neural-cadherin-like isoform X2 n=1 Tax=Lates japonicus TaxID=270547 RepID=A0AAD3RNB7_LATJO|nr:neural-cadherin-like isoform X2 [Lates japonicus]